MFVHCVYFWLKPDLDEVSRKQFVSGLESLVAIDSVRQGYFGTPATTDRSIIDRTYSYALVCAFDDEAGHDHYQSHPDHDTFRDECGAMWTRVTIYDFEGKRSVDLLVRQARPSESGVGRSRSELEGGRSTGP